MEAILGFEDFHEIPLRFVATLPSLKVPVAVSFNEVPLAMRGFAGLMVIETRWAVETVSVVDPLTPPKVAFTVVVPVAKLVANPCALTVATAGVDDVQSTADVMSC
jgi:hypothetical protein